MDNNKQLLTVTGISDVMTATDGREYATISVQEPSQPGLIITTRPHKKNIWSHQPNSGPNAENPVKVPYFEQIVDAMEKNGEATITGRVVTVETEPYFIENLESGKYRDPDTGVPSNRATQKTYVLFPDESVERELNNDGLIRKGSERGPALKHPDEDLVSEDLGAEVDAAMS